MDRKFSIAHLTALECTPPELIYIAAKTGYDFVSLRPIAMGLPSEPRYDLYNDKKLKSETKAAFSETGMKLLDIELAKIYDGMNARDYLPAFEVAAELGAKHVLSSIWSDDHHYAIDQFGEVCDLANQFGLTVELEFVPIASVKTLKGAIDILETVNRANAGLMIDLHHFHRSKDKIEDLKLVHDRYFKYFHLCDCSGETPKTEEELIRIMREERLYAGEGGVNIAGIVASLPPNLPCSIELPNKKRSEELGYEEYARRCLAAAKEYLANYTGKEMPRTSSITGMNTKYASGFF